jgi:Tfp pilus assembly protein PilN
VSQVNLLPPDIRQGQRYRRVTGLVVLAGLAILGLIILFYLLQVGRLGAVNDDIAAQQANNATLNTQIAELSKYENLQAEAQQQQQLLNDAYAGEVSYSGLMMDMSRVVPADAFLSALSVTTPGAAAAPATTPTTTTTEFIGSMTASGEAIGFDSLSQWLTNLAGVNGWENPWMPTITADSDVSNAYQFTSSVDLGTAAETPRGRGEVSTGG